MNTDDNSTLDTFEEELLRELRTLVEQNAAAADATPARVRRPRRAWYAAAALAVAALLVALLTPVVRPEPAFAVTGRNGEKITVHVMRLEGAPQLEQALRERGVASDITYLPTGKSCAPNRYTERHTPDLVLGVAVDWFEVTIPPDAVGPNDTFVLSASVTPLPNGFQSSVDFGITAGDIAPCRVIDTP